MEVVAIAARNGEAHRTTALKGDQTSSKEGLDMTGEGKVKGSLCLVEGICGNITDSGSTHH